jgi:hypothetical protein
MYATTQHGASTQFHYGTLRSNDQHNDAEVTHAACSRRYQHVRVYPFGNTRQESARTLVLTGKHREMALQAGSANSRLQKPAGK